MNNNLTELIFVLDRSGSMEHLTLETIGGFNSLIEHQKEEDGGEVRVTTVLFDDQYTLLHDRLPIAEVPRLTKRTYYARGCTALLDAVGRTIDNVGMRLAETPESERPGKILFVITTDGYENASCNYTRKMVKEMITRQQEIYKWKFLFLGANIDAVGEADSLGIRSCQACRPTASASGVQTSYAAISHLASFIRNASTIPAPVASPCGDSDNSDSVCYPSMAYAADFDEDFEEECLMAFSEVQ